MFPELTFDLRYFESGMGFNGRYACRDGGAVFYDEQAAYYGTRGG